MGLEQHSKVGRTHALHEVDLYLIPAPLKFPQAALILFPEQRDKNKP